MFTKKTKSNWAWVTWRTSSYRNDDSSETPADKMHTMATLLYAMRAWLENVKLPLGDNGEVDMTTNPLTLPKVIFAPCDNSDGIGSIERLLKASRWQRCKYAKLTNGKGGYEDNRSNPTKDDCKYVKIPDIGTSLGKYCDPVTKNMMDRIADGRGGSKSGDRLFVNDPACGYVKPQEAGTKLFEFCSGVNMMAATPDGKGGFNDVPILINIVKCNGENLRLPKYGTNPGGTSKAKIALSSTHTKLYKGTFEVMVIAFSGLQPNTQ